MSGRAFLDTNVLVYLFDADSPDKQRAARSLFEEIATGRQCSLSTQVLQEFYVSVTRKLGRPLPAPQAFQATQRLTALHIVQVDTPMVLAAIELSQRIAVSFWDALILKAALAANCSTLLTEDLQHSQTVDGLRIENPFREAGP